MLFGVASIAYMGRRLTHIYHICEQPSNALHHINRMKLFTENSAMSRLQDILRGWGRLSPETYLSESHDFNTLRTGLSCGKTTARGAAATETGRGCFNVQFILDFFTKVCNTMNDYREQRIP